MDTAGSGMGQRCPGTGAEAAHGPGNQEQACHGPRPEEVAQPGGNDLSGRVVALDRTLEQCFGRWDQESGSQHDGFLLLLDDSIACLSGAPSSTARVEHSSAVSVPPSGAGATKWWWYCSHQRCDPTTAQDWDAPLGVQRPTCSLAGVEFDYDRGSRWRRPS
jgi:hypothetical protein